MEKPKLENTQFALMVVDSLTGIVLNTDLKMYTSDDTPVYFIFNDLTSLKVFIERLNNSSDTYEYYIHDYKYDVIEFIKAKKWS